MSDAKPPFLPPITPLPTPAPPTLAPARASTPSPFARSKDTNTVSVIGDDLTIMGEKVVIVSQNKIQIDGDVLGDIRAREIEIGREGSVVGSVAAEIVKINGGVQGIIRGATVSLEETAKVRAEVVHQTLQVANGCDFEGAVRRPKDASELKPNLDVSAFETVRLQKIDGGLLS